MRSEVRVLVADDNRLVRETMRVRLAEWGMRAEMAPDGETAWRMLQDSSAPRIAILDWSMPGLDGLEVCRRVRAAQGDHYTYVILLTAHEGEESIAKGFAAGADDYVGKDAPVHVLRTRLMVAQRIAAVQEEVLRARELLRDQAQRDGLTGLLNRRAAEEELDRELRRAARGGGPFGLVLLDLDRFKSINDTWGHPAGDRVLAGTAEVLRTVLRAEEFLVVLPQVDLDGAAAAAERIRTAILETPFHLPHGVLHVTASLGVAVVPVGGRSRDELLASVDAALYRAKERSRNCVMMEAPATPRRPMLANVLDTSFASSRIA